MLSRQIALGPVWLLTLLLRPLLPSAHPWKRQRLTLSWWAAGATEFSYTCAAVFWLHLVLWPVVVWSLTR